MKSIWFALGLCCAAPQPAFAQAPTPAAPGEVDPARLAASRQLIALMKIEDSYDMMFKPLTPVFAQAVVGMMQGDPLTRAALQMLFTKGDGGQDRFVAILSDEFMRSMRARYPLLKEAAAAEYAKSFTEAELGDLIAFYSSGTGSKALTVLPDLQKRIAATSEQIGKVAGEEAGRRAFERAEREMLPPRKTTKS